MEHNITRESSLIVSWGGTPVSSTSDLRFGTWDILTSEIPCMLGFQEYCANGTVCHSKFLCTLKLYSETQFFAQENIKIWGFGSFKLAPVPDVNGAAGPLRRAVQSCCSVMGKAGVCWWLRTSALVWTQSAPASGSPRKPLVGFSSSCSAHAELRNVKVACTDRILWLGATAAEHTLAKPTRETSSTQGFFERKEKENSKRPLFGQT